MWLRHVTKLSSVFLTFSFIINKGYSGHVVLSDCHVTITVSSWSLHGSCFVSTPFDQFTCYWVSEHYLAKHILPSTFNKTENGDTGLSNKNWTCSFSSSVPRQEGKYSYYIYSDPQPANPYSFDMLINGTDDTEIVESTIWVENGAQFGNFTCNASSYFPDILYIWSVPCQTESNIDKTSVCTTSITDRRTEVTCIAVNVSTAMTVYDKGSSQSPKEALLTSVLLGSTLGMCGIVSLSIGIAVYLKRQKGAGRHHISDYSTEDAIRNSTSSSLRINDLSNFTQEEHPGTSNNLDPVSDKSTKRRQEWDSGQNTHQNPLTMTVEACVLREGIKTSTAAYHLEESAKFDIRCPDNLYENITTRGIQETNDAVDLRQTTSFIKSKEESRPQSHSDTTLYNRLSFFTYRRPLSAATQSDSVYNRLDQQ